MKTTQVQNEIDSNLFLRIKEKEHIAFTLLFQKYYLDLVYYCGSYIPEKNICEDIVQEIFVSLWEESNIRKIQSSIRYYLIRSCRNRCIDHIRHLNVRQSHVSSVLNSPPFVDNEVEEYVLYSELKQHLSAALNNIDSQYREVFEKNRLKHMTHKEIAEELGVSVRTVESRMSKALELLRISLIDFLTILLLFSY